MRSPSARLLVIGGGAGLAAAARGFDLANISFVKGNTGWIVFDPLTGAVRARSAPRSPARRTSRR